MSNFETWWQQEGQEFLFALNTTTDDDIKLVAEVAWKNGAYCAAPQPVQEDHDGHWSDCSVHNEPAYPNGPCDCGGYPPKHWRCACGANLYIDSNGAPASKAEQVKQEDKDLVAQMNIDVGLKQKVYEALAEQATVSDGLCGGCAKKAADGWALYCVECWENAEQRSDSERMEPVACKSVPIEPTEDMLLAAELSQPRGYRELYVAMISAAPVQQAEQEPVGEVFQEEYGLDVALKLPLPPAGTKLYAAPVRTKDLTGEEIERILTEQPNGEHMNLHWFYNAARAVIAADREKNR